MIQHEINRLIHFARQQGLIEAEDMIYCANQLLGVLRLDAFEPESIEEALETPTPILENILNDAVARGIVEDTVTERDLFDTQIMNCVMPRPSEVIRIFKALHMEAPRKATDYYYRMNIASNYIRKARIDKNIIWKTKTEYGALDITINLSKPEKDPRDIAKAKRMTASSYPSCLLCKENEGFCGRINHPARQTHRIIPLKLGGAPWFLQYSPYTYYNEHCIVLNSAHLPMKISEQTFVNLLDFIDLFPHYFAGSNADLPIVGGSILSHDHYQGGRYTFAMEMASVEETYQILGYEALRVGRIKWPMSAIRIAGKDKKALIALAVHILHVWRGYSDAAVDILSETKGEPHNTITPIARSRGGDYELDLVLRNNRTSQAHPLGIFHPHSEVHHIKKENIGLIEVMGLAVLPGRLKTELGLIEAALLAKKEDIADVDAIAKHADWYYDVKQRCVDLDAEATKAMLRSEVGKKFLSVLSHAGVFKRNIPGMEAFNKFMAAL